MDPTYWGVPWAEFVATWCDGYPPAEDPSVVALGLESLSRLDPDYAAPVIANKERARGLMIVVSAVHRGLVLRLCEGLDGFGPVLTRIRAGEWSAFMEATCAAGLVRIGHRPRLEFPIGGRTPDFRVDIGEQVVFGEVVAPDRAEEVNAAIRFANTLAAELMPLARNLELELFLPYELPRQQLANVVRRLKHASESDEIQQIGPEIQFSKRAARNPGELPVLTTWRIPLPPGVPIMAAHNTQVGDGATHNALVRLKLSDSRGRRFVDKEIKHFSKDTTNLLVVDVTNVPGGMEDWEPLLRRGLQPRINTRLGAIVIIAHTPYEPPWQIRLRCTVVPNPHSPRAIPVQFLTDLAALDQLTDTMLAAVRPGVAS